MKTFLLMVLLWCSTLLGQVCSAAGGEWHVVETILQRSGEKRDNTVSFFYPRIEHKKKNGNPQFACASTVGSRVTFTWIGRGLAAIEGVIVARSGEAETVVRKLLAEGLRVTKSDQVSKREQPVMTGVHFTGRGYPESLVWAFTPALSATGTPMGPVGFPDTDCRKILKGKGTP